MILSKELKYVQTIIIVFSFIFLITDAQAQQLKLGNHPTQINSSAVLELESKNQGLLLSRIADTNNIVNPLDGMIIYFTDGAAEEPYGAHAGLYEQKNGSWVRAGIPINTEVPKDQGIKFTLENGKYTLHIPNANQNLRGLMSTGHQTWGGGKVFIDSVAFRDSVTIKVLHPGSILFIGVGEDKDTGTITENNSHLFWDNEKESLGIGTNTPNANLDVKGTFKLGEAGSILNHIIRDSMETTAERTLNTDEGYLYSFLLPAVNTGASIITSPKEQLPDGCVIAYSYSTAGEVFIEIQNTGSSQVTISENTKFYVAIIQ